MNSEKLVDITITIPTVLPLEELQIGMKIRCNVPGLLFDKMEGEITDILWDSMAPFPVTVRLASGTDVVLAPNEMEVIG